MYENLINIFQYQNKNEKLLLLLWLLLVFYFGLTIYLQSKKNKSATPVSKTEVKLNNTWTKSGDFTFVYAIFFLFFCYFLIRFFNPQNPQLENAKVAETMSGMSDLLIAINYLLGVSIIYLMPVALLFFVLKNVRRMSLAQIFGVDKDRKLIAFAIGLGFMLISLPLIIVSKKFIIDELLIAKGIIIQQEQDAVLNLLFENNIYSKITLIIATCLLAPVAEEIIFRGYIYATLKKFIGKWHAIIGSSLVFALIHQNAVIVIPLFLLAIFFCLSYEKTGNIIAPISAHMAFNSINAFAILVTN